MDVIRLPVPTPITVGIVVTNPILIDFTIAIIVDTFLTEHFVLSYLVRAHLHQSSRIKWILNKSTRWRFANHHGDVTIAVQVIHSILSIFAIAIVVQHKHS